MRLLELNIVATGAVCQCITYAMQIPEGPFAVRVIAYGIAGFGIAIQVGTSSLSLPFVLTSIMTECWYKRICW